MKILQLLYSQSRFIDIDFYKNHMVFRIPLYHDIIKNIVNVKIVNNEIVIKTKLSPLK
jgi:hypothetical protein